MTVYLAYSLQTEQCANVKYEHLRSTSHLPTHSLCDWATTDSSCESPPLPPSGWRSDWCCRVLILLSKIQMALSPSFTNRHHFPWLWRMHLLAKYSNRKKQILTGPWLWIESECTRRWGTQRRRIQNLYRSLSYVLLSRFSVLSCFSFSAPPDLPPL